MKAKFKEGDWVKYNEYPKFAFEIINTTESSGKYFYHDDEGGVFSEEEITLVCLAENREDRKDNGKG